MKSDEYWQKRAEQCLIEAEQITARAEQEMKQAFDAAYADIESCKFTGCTANTPPITN